MAGTMASGPPTFALNGSARTLLAIDFIFAVLAFIAVSLRCYVRICMVKAFGLDDYLMVAAMATFITYAGFSINGAFHGTGQHLWDLPPDDIPEAMRSWFCCYLFYCTTMILSKLSIGYFLFRVTVKKIHNYIIYAAVTITILAGLALFFVTLFQCQPMSYFWNQMQDGTCVDPNIIVALGFVYSSFAIISDFTLALLPAWIISQLQMNRRTKMALIPLVAMGTIASGGVVARLPYLPSLKDDDFLYATLDIAVWSTVEQGLAIVAGSLATTRPLFKLATSKLGWSRPSGTRPSTGAGLPGFSRSRANSRGDAYNLSKPTRSKNGTWKDQSVFDVEAGEVDDGGEGKEIGLRTMITGGRHSTVVRMVQPPPPPSAAAAQAHSSSTRHHQQRARAGTYESGGSDEGRGLRSKESYDDAQVVVAKSFLITRE